jgi:hypothetical protein
VPEQYPESFPAAAAVVVQARQQLSVKPQRFCGEGMDDRSDGTDPTRAACKRGMVETGVNAGSKALPLVLGNALARSGSKKLLP